MKLYIAGAKTAFAKNLLFSEEKTLPTVHSWLTHFGKNLPQFLEDGKFNDVVQTFPKFVAYGLLDQDVGMRSAVTPTQTL